MSRSLPWHVLAPLAVGLAALALGLLRLWWAPAAFFRGYLPACLFWIGIPVGSLALLMIHGLTGGAWGHFMRPVLNAGAAVLPVNVAFFVPLAFGLGEIFPWAMSGWHPEGVTGGQAVWFKPGFFLAREAVVLASWVGLGAMLGVWRNGMARVERGGIQEAPHSAAMPQAGHTPLRTGEARHALGLIVFGLTVTVFAIDWIMSLEPRWSSTNIGFLAAASALLLAMSFGTSTLCRLVRDRSPGPATAACFGDLGGLLLAFLLLWAYLAFEQYLTIWSENLPDKAIWYIQRNTAGWRAWSWLQAVVAGALPFFLLLSRDLKRDPRRLVWAVRLLLAGQLLDMYWQVMPSFYPAPGAMSVLDTLPWVGTGGLWLAAYLWWLPRYRVEEQAHG